MPHPGYSALFSQYSTFVLSDKQQMIHLDGYKRKDKNAILNLTKAGSPVSKEGMKTRMRADLPETFHVRPPTLDDTQIVVDLIRFCQLREWGAAITTLEDALALWQSPEVELEQDARLIFAPDNQLVAYVELLRHEPLRMSVNKRIHPDYDTLELDRALLAFAEERARQLIPQLRPDARISLQTTHSALTHLVAAEAAKQAGFTYIRSQLRMEIVMETPPPAPIWPEGLVLRPFTLEMAKAVHAADNEAFRDHWGFTPLPFETFEHIFIKSLRFDPTLWFVLFDGEEIAGSALCEHRAEGGYVGSLGVQRPWRRQGLGLALLHHAFGEFYRRGEHKVTLFVDAQNLTGATRLYERAGMKVVRQFAIYEKELRPGIELSTQELEA